MFIVDRLEGVGCGWDAYAASSSTITSPPGFGKQESLFVFYMIGFNSCSKWVHTKWVYREGFCLCPWSSGSAIGEQQYMHSKEKQVSKALLCGSSIACFSFQGILGSHGFVEFIQADSFGGVISSGPCL